MKSNPLVALCVVAVGLTGLCEKKSSAAIQASAFCRRGPHDTMLVTDRGVDGLGVDWPLKRLRDRCPAARDTLYAWAEGSYPALQISFRGATILAVQASDAGQPDLSAPADFWIVSGDSVRLPSQLSLKAKWAALRSAYGGAVGQALDESLETIDFTFCALPRLRFRISAAGVDSTASLTDPASYPDSAHVRAVLILTKGNSVPSRC